MTLTSTPLTPSPATKNPSKTPGTPLSSTQLLSHPAYPTNDWSHKIPPTKTGNITINTQSARPGGPLNISYDIHGSGPTKIVWIMGLGALRSSWKRQAKFFGHDGGRGEEYSSLVFDNRGVGGSGKPRCRYSTREMAGDVVELLGGLGWLGGDVVEGVMGGFYAGGSGKKEGTDRPAKRDLVIAGVSMGGMIAQELALLIPNHIQALILISTCPRLIRTAPFLENLRQRINMFIPRNVDVQLEEIAYRLFSASFLEQPDTENSDPTLNFPTNRDRWAASEMAKRMDKESFQRVGFILQSIAAGWHHKSKEQLLEMVEKVGGKRIAIIHGTDDRMLTFAHFEAFKREIGEDKGVEYRVWEGAGHVLPWEVEREFNEYVEGVIRRTGEMRDG